MSEDMDRGVDTAEEFVRETEDKFIEGMKENIRLSGLSFIEDALEDEYQRLDPEGKEDHEEIFIETGQYTDGQGNVFTNLAGDD